MKLCNKQANMEIGVTNGKLWIRKGQTQEIYGTISAHRTHEFLQAIIEWDEAGESDGEIEY